MLRSRLLGASTGPGLAALLVLAVIVGFDAAPADAQELAGLYTVTGTELGKGTYTGTAELRWAGDHYAFVRTITYSTYLFEGQKVATAWEGTASGTASGLAVAVPLRRMGWISAAGGLTRTAADATPITVTGSFTSVAGAPLSGAFAGPGLSAFERCTYSGAVGPTPHFAKAIVITEFSGAPCSVVKAAFFALYRSYHLLPAVAPYTSKPEFKAAAHYNVMDRTDFSFLRDHPDTIRVVNAVVDAINLREAEVRANAFRHTLAAKAALKDAAAPTFVNPLGMLADYKDPATGAIDSYGDSAEWTASYIASQSFRYQMTGEPAALANVEHCLDAMLLLADVPGVPGVFARAVRPAVGPLPGGWNAGTGAYAGVYWLPGHNNDMLKGLMYGYLMAYDALPATHPKRQAIRTRVKSLIASSSLINDGLMNEILWNCMAAYMTGEVPYQTRYLALMKKPWNLLWILVGDGTMGKPTIADWSGNHLHTITYIMIILLASKSSSDPYLGVYRMGYRNAWNCVRHTRPALLSLGYAAFGGSTVKPNDADWFEDAHWVLREMPAVNAGYAVNHSLRADWCISPFPSLPWKRDWMTDEGRQGSLYAYALYQQPQTCYQWKENPISFKGGGSGMLGNGADYLHAYWLGRKFGVIGADE